MTLVNSKTKQPVNVGDIVTTFRGQKARVTRIIEPHHAGSTGRVVLEFGESDPWEHSNADFFPAVIGAEWIGR